MKSIKLKYPIIAALAALAITACEAEVELDQPSPQAASGQADFTKYIALGNSLTAGYADAALNRQGQVWSYPAIIAEKMQTVVPDLVFAQPLLPEGRANGTRYIQGFNPAGRPIIVAETNGLGNQQIFAPVNTMGPFQNLGVPGAKVGDLIQPFYGSSQGNPYFARFASSAATTIVTEAVVQNPTFFTLWIGNNDVLGYATQGGEGTTITDPAVFEQQYRSIITQLKGTNANIEGALANISSITEIPFFNTVPWNAFEVNEQQAAQINAVFKATIDPNIKAAVTQAVRKSAYDQAIANGATPEQANQFADQYIASDPGKAVINTQTEQTISDLKAAKFYPTIQAGPNGFIVYSDDSPTTIKQLTASEKMTLTFTSTTPDEFNPANNLIIVPDKYALDAAELARVTNAITAYNDIIAAVATENTFALVDMNTFFNQVVTGGVTTNGTTFTNAFVLGNAFSLDGVHLTPKGYALVAARFIDEINEYYGSNIPKPNLDRYPAVIFPSGQ